MAVLFGLRCFAARRFCVNQTLLQTKLDLGELDDFLREAEPPQVYPRGTDLFSQGNLPQCVFVLSEGLVKLVRGRPDGHVTVVGLRSRGWIVGVGAALLDQPFETTVTTVTQCQAYRFSAAAFRAHVRRNEELSWYLHRMHVEEIGRSIAHSVGLSSLSARQRLEKFFEAIVSELPSKNHELEIPLRDWEIAQLISVTPPYLSRLVHEIIHEGWLHRVHGRLLVSNDRPTETKPVRTESR